MGTSAISLQSFTYHCLELFLSSNFFKNHLVRRFSLRLYPVVMDWTNGARCTRRSMMAMNTTHLVKCDRARPQLQEQRLPYRTVRVPNLLSQTQSIRLVWSSYATVRILARADRSSIISPILQLAYVVLLC